MKCLSIRQPWAHMILHHGKDVENRTWKKNVTGRILIHASKGMTRTEWEDAWDFAFLDCGIDGVGRFKLTIDTILRGGIVGSVEIIGCLSRSESPWFCGPYGFILRDPIVLPFSPCKGKLGFFNDPRPPRVTQQQGE